MISERNLQSNLFALLSEYSPCEPIVEPVWNINGKKLVPDIVLVKAKKIAAVFELKFVPHYYANYDHDLCKLKQYISSNTQQPVRINPITGKWVEEYAQLEASCEAHFVVIAHKDAEATHTEIKADFPQLNLWYGRTNGQEVEWSIDFASQH